MEKQVLGKVVAAKMQWWLKVNTKPFRKHMLDGATFPYIIKVLYSVDGVVYSRKKWIKAGHPYPPIESVVRVVYDEGNPKKSKIIC